MTLVLRTQCRLTISNFIPFSHKKKSFAAIWMELETLKLSEVSQKEKDKNHMISFISGI